LKLITFYYIIKLYYELYLFFININIAENAENLLKKTLVTVRNQLNFHHEH